MMPESGDAGDSGNGKFSEEELIALGSPRAGDELYLATDTGRIVYANDRFADELAYLPHEIMERTIPEVDTKHSRAKWLHFVSTLKKAGKSLTFETSFEIKGGGTIDMAIIASYISYKGKNYILCQGKALDDTDEDEAIMTSGEDQSGKMRVLLATVSDGIVFVNSKGDILETNATADRMLGYSKNEIIGRSYVDPRWRLVDAQGNTIKISDHPVSVALVSETPISNKRMAVMQPDGGLKYLFINAAPVFDSAGTLTGAVYTMRYQGGIGEMHIPASKATPGMEKLSEIARRFGGATTIFELERAVCDTLAQGSDYGVVWVGVMESEDAKIEPSYSAGDTTDYLLKVKERADSSDFGKGPTGRAIKTRKPYIINDIESAPEFSPWKRQAQRSNLQAFASFPIIVHNNVYGVLNLAAKDRNHFTESEIQVLKEVSQFLSFGIQALRDKDTNIHLEERNILNNLLVDTLIQSTDAAVAIFEARPPFMCTFNSEGFLSMLDEPFRSAGVKDALLTEIAHSLIHRDLYDVFMRAIDDVEPQSEENVEFRSFNGGVEHWNWVVFPIMHGNNVTSLLYSAVKTTGRERGEECMVLDRLPVGVYSVSFERREVRYANPAAGYLLGLKTGSMAKHALPFLAGIPKEELPPITSQLDLLAARKRESISIVYTLPDKRTGEDIEYSAVLTGDYSESGVLRGVYVIAVPLQENIIEEKPPVEYQTPAAPKAVVPPPAKTATPKSHARKTVTAKTAPHKTETPAANGAKEPDEKTTNTKETPPAKDQTELDIAVSAPAAKETPVKRTRTKK